MEIRCVVVMEHVNFSTDNAISKLNFDGVHVVMAMKALNKFRKALSYDLCRRHEKDLWKDLERSTDSQFTAHLSQADNCCLLCTLRQSIEKMSSKYRKRTSKSRLSPAYTHATISITHELLLYKIGSVDILLVVFYAAQKRVYTTVLNVASINMPLSTIDGVQGIERSIVVVDNDRPDARYPLPFVNVTRRLGVLLLSRAQNGSLSRDD